MINFTADVRKYVYEADFEQSRLLIVNSRGWSYVLVFRDGAELGTDALGDTG